MFDNYYWTSSKGNKYQMIFCDLTQAWVIISKCCDGSSSNGVGCAKCTEDHREFNDCKYYSVDYLNKEESMIAQKIRLLNKYIPICLSNGYKQINWKFLHNEGYLCDSAYDLFNLDEEKL